MIIFSIPVVVADGVNVGELVSDALRDIGMSNKEAYVTCGLDAAQWSRGLHGLATLDLWKLRKLPKAFWIAFAGKVGAAWRSQRVTELTIELEMAKAELRSLMTRMKESA